MTFCVYNVYLGVFVIVLDMIYRSMMNVIWKF